MKTSIQRAVQLIIIFPLIILLTACQSNPAQTNTANATNSQTSSEKQQEYDQLLQDWKTLKPGITRLVAIEEELNLLLGQLSQLSSALNDSQANANLDNLPAPAAGIPTQNTALGLESHIVNEEPKVAVAEASKVAATAAPSTELSMPVTAVIPQAAPEITQEITPAVATTRSQTPTNVENNSEANFSLQVASITEPSQLPDIWQLMQNKNPALLAGMTPNYQKVFIKNTDYYRLKIGAFSNRSEATQKCAQLKAAGIDCIVTNYSQSDFAQLARFSNSAALSQLD